MKSIILILALLGSQANAAINDYDVSILHGKEKNTSIIEIAYHGCVTSMNIKNDKLEIFLNDAKMIQEVVRAAVDNANHGCK